MTEDVEVTSRIQREELLGLLTKPQRITARMPAVVLDELIVETSQAVIVDAPPDDGFVVTFRAPAAGTPTPVVHKHVRKRQTTASLPVIEAAIDAAIDAAVDAAQTNDAVDAAIISCSLLIVPAADSRDVQSADSRDQSADSRDVQSADSRDRLGKLALGSGQIAAVGVAAGETKRATRERTEATEHEGAETANERAETEGFERAETTESESHGLAPRSLSSGLDLSALSLWSHLRSCIASVFALRVRPRAGIVALSFACSFAAGIALVLALA